MKIEFVGQSMRDSDNIAANPSRLVNCYREGTGNGEHALKSVLGMTDFAQIDGVFVRCMDEIGGKIYAAGGGSFYSLTQGGTLRNLGAIEDSEDASVAGNNGLVTLATGGKLYVLDDLTLYEPSYGAFSNIGSVEYVGNYTVVTERNGRRFGWSDIANPLAWPGLNFSTADGRDDDLIRAVAINGSLYLLKEKSHEVWYITGGAGAEAFSRISGGVKDVGLKAFGLVCKFIGAAFMVGSDGRAHLVSGGALQPVSTPAVETAIKTKSPVNCMSYEDEGHTFCAIVFRDAPAWVYDVATGEWHERAEGEDFARWSAAVSAKLGDFWYVGRNSGEISRLERSNNDADLPLVREATSRTLEFDGERPILRELEAFIRQGFTDGQIGLFLSGDSGLTWGLEKAKPIGPIGEYARRVIWRNLGQFRRVTARLRWTDPADVNLSASLRVKL